MTHKEFKTARNMPETELNGKQNPSPVYIEEKSERRKRIMRRSFFATLAVMLAVAVIAVVVNVNHTEPEPEFTGTTMAADDPVYGDTAGETAGSGERIAVPYMHNGNVRNRYVTVPYPDKLDVPKLDKETKERMETMRKNAGMIEKIRHPETGRFKTIEGRKPPKIIEAESGKQAADTAGAK